MEDAANRTPGSISRESIDMVYRFALRRTSSTEDAQDVAQDIAVELVRSLPGRKAGRSFDAWMWTIANRTFWRWLDRRRRRVALYAVNALDEEVLGTEDGEPERELARREELGLLRREIALLASAYRSVLVLHYVEGLGTAEVAVRLGLPLGTVTWRLHEARRSIRRGMSTMRTNGQRSYAPGRLWTAMNGTISGPRTWAPWEMFSRSLPQNIALAAYREPVTLEALSLELGVSRPYVEDEVRLLCERQGIRKAGRDAYETDFTIFSRQDSAGVHEALGEAARRLTPRLRSTLGSREARIRAVGFHGSSFDWSRLLWLLAPWTILECSRLLPGRIGYRIEYPRRPNGAWFLVGFEAGQDELPLEGGLSVCLDSDPQGGAYKSCIFWTNALGHWAGHLTLAEARVASRLLGEPVEAAALGGSESETAAALASRGYVRRVDGRVAFDAVGLTRAQHDALAAILGEAAGEILDDMAALYARLRLLLEGSVPSRLHPQLPQRLEASCFDVAWHVWEELASQGAIVKPRDPATSTDGTYLVVEH